VTQVRGFEEFSLDDDRSLGKTYFTADEMLQYHFSTRAFVTEVPFEAEQSVRAWWFKRFAEEKEAAASAAAAGRPDNGEDAERSGGNLPVAVLVQEGCEAALEAMRGLLPKFAMCDAGDIRTAYVGASDCIYAQQALEGNGNGNPGGAGCHSRLMVYDQFIGGVGLADRAYERGNELWGDVRETVRTCPCRAGCPRCIGAPKKGMNLRHAQAIKAAAGLILDGLHGEWAAPDVEDGRRVEVSCPPGGASAAPWRSAGGGTPSGAPTAVAQGADATSRVGGARPPLEQVPQFAGNAGPHPPATALPDKRPPLRNTADHWPSRPQQGHVSLCEVPELSPEEEEEMLALEMEPAGPPPLRDRQQGVADPPPAKVWAERARVAALTRLYQG